MTYVLAPAQMGHLPLIAQDEDIHIVYLCNNHTQIHNIHYIIIRAFIGFITPDLEGGGEVGDEKYEIFKNQK